MKSPRTLSAVAVALFAALLAPPLAHADGRGGKPRPPIRRPGAGLFKFSHASYRPTVKVEEVRVSGENAVAVLRFRVRRGHVDELELLIDGTRVAGRELPGSPKSGTATLAFPAALLAGGAHTLRAHAHQGRPGHQSIKGISKALVYTL